MNKVTNSTRSLSDTEGDLGVIVRALCYAVTIATDDVHKKYLAELVFRITNIASVNWISAEELKLNPPAIKTENGN